MMRRGGGPTSSSSRGKGTEKRAVLDLPLLLHDGNIFQERGGADEVDDDHRNTTPPTSSMMIPEYIDEAIGPRHSLRPTDAVGLYNMRLFIQRHSRLPSLFRDVLCHPTKSERMRKSSDLLDLLRVVNADLDMFPDGPYLCGLTFTLADVHILPYVERIVVVLSKYRNFWIPSSLSSLLRWYDVVMDRPAVRAATSDRDGASLSAYCFEEVSRNAYLLEVYECHARDEVRLFEALNGGPGGRAGYNVYRREVVVPERERLRRRNEEGWRGDDSGGCVSFTNPTLKSICEYGCAIC